MLIVDDNEDSRLLQQTALSSCGYTVETAADGREALEKARTAAPDVIVSDLLMPHMDGFELCRAVKSDPALRHIPFIVYTATYVEPKDEELALSLGASRFVVKPAEPMEFLRIVRETLDSVPRLDNPREPRIDEEQFAAAHEERVSRKLDKKLAELALTDRALKNVEQSYRELFEGLSDIVLRTDTEGRLMLVNPAWSSLLGRSVESSLGRPLTDFVLEEDRQACAVLVKEAVRGSSDRKVCNLRFQAADGTVRWFGARLQPHREGDGTVTALTGVLRDITRQQQALSDLQTSEAKYRRLMEQAGDAILLVDAGSGCILEANLRLEALTGCQREALIGQPLETLYPEALCSRQRGLLARVLPGGGVVREEQTIVCEGEAVPVEVSASALEVEGTATVQLILRDLSERRRAEERLRQHAEVFRSIAEGVIITDADQRILAVNPAFTRITGYSEEEVLGNKPGLLRSGRHDRDFYLALWASIHETGQWQGEIWNRRKCGEIYPQLLTISAVKDAEGRVVNYIGVFADISRVKESERRLEHLAHHDPLTDLPNRLLFRARLEHAIQQARRKGRKLAVLFIDLDRFKHINDSLGHAVGDLLLTQVPQRMQVRVRQGDTLSRLGGDEFTVLLEDIDGTREAALVAEKLLRGFEGVFEVEGREFYLTASIGIGLFPDDGEEAETLLRNADAAMYLAKEQGRNSYRFYTRELTATAFERLSIESSLRRAIEREEFFLHYQPLVRISSGDLVGVEALVRWSHDGLGVVAPGKFIPLAEETGLIVPIGQWVLETACAQAQAWRDEGLPLGRISVNVSGQQIRRSDLGKTVRGALEHSGLPGSCLELEITESSFMESNSSQLRALHELHALGVRIAIDDFGTGYSSLSRLKQLPIDTLKIDRSFVRDIPQDPDDVAIAEAVIALARSLQLKVLAEGVENPEQRDFLRELGCDDAQGYLYAQPMAPDRLIAWWRSEMRE
ncbi:MAG: hypothetical protein Kow006_04440 [Gammaproteobacteria bacterium]